jgi:hypothetical protein
MKTAKEWLGEAQDRASVYRQQLETGDVRLLELEPAYPVQKDDAEGGVAGADDSAIEVIGTGADCLNRGQ